MIVERYVVGMLATNCYLVGDRQTRQAAVVDPGDDAERIVDRVRDLGLELSAVLLTHGHFDHVLDAWAVQEELGGKIYLHRGDQSLLGRTPAGLGVPFVSAGATPPGRVDHWLKEGDIVEIGAIRLHVLETPGHTPGQVAFHCPNQKMLFVGDTIFSGSIGRTDMPGGSYEQLIHSVREKIFPLPGDTQVHPGHGPSTTVGTEKSTNPFF